jgi:hypothetical protein
LCKECIAFLNNGWHYSLMVTEERSGDKVVAVKKSFI